MENDSEAAEIPDMQITTLAEASFEAGSTKEVGPGSAPKWHGYDLSALPIDVRPSVDSKGKHSFTVKREEGKISVDILLRQGAFWVKKPEQCKGQYSWARYSSVHEAWDALLHDCRACLGMPCYMTAEHVWECQLVQLGWIQQSRGCWISVARSTCAHWMQMQNMFFCSVPAKLCSFLLSRHVHVLLPCELTCMH